MYHLWLNILIKRTPPDGPSGRDELRTSQIGYLSELRLFCIIEIRIYFFYKNINEIAHVNGLSNHLIYFEMPPPPPNEWYQTNSKY